MPPVATSILQMFVNLDLDIKNIIIGVVAFVGGTVFGILMHAFISSRKFLFHFDQ